MERTKSQPVHDGDSSDEAIHVDHQAAPHINEQLRYQVKQLQDKNWQLLREVEQRSAETESLKRDYEGMF